MTDTQLDAANKIKTAIAHFKARLDLEDSDWGLPTEFPHDDEEYVRLQKLADERLKDLYRQRIAELEKQFAEV